MKRTWYDTSKSPRQLLKLARKQLSPRKVEFLGAAACRIIQPIFDETITFNLVELLEQRATLQISESEYQAARTEFLDLIDTTQNQRNAEALYIRGSAIWAAQALLHHRLESLDLAFEWIGYCHHPMPESTTLQSNRRNEQRLGELVREMLYDPSHEWHIISPSQGGGLNQPDGRTVRLDDNALSLAGAIDAQCSYTMMPILADALDESGITDRAMLAHCREDREHLPGCWVIDLVLGRQ